MVSTITTTTTTTNNNNNNTRHDASYADNDVGDDDIINGHASTNVDYDGDIVTGHAASTNPTLIDNPPLEVVQDESYG